MRADVHVAHDGRPKGSGLVAFETTDDARNAISQFNGYEWQGRVLEVREDRFAGSSSGNGRGAYSGLGGRGAYGSRSFGGRGGPGAIHNSRSSYGGNYNPHSGAYDANTIDLPGNTFTDTATGGGDRGQIIYVRNVRSPVFKTYFMLIHVSYLGQRAMTILLNCLPPLGRLRERRFNMSLMVAHAVPVLLNLTT